MKENIKLIQSPDDQNLYRFYDTDCYLVKNDDYYMVREEGVAESRIIFSLDTPLDTIETAFTWWFTGYKDCLYDYWKRKNNLT